MSRALVLLLIIGWIFQGSWTSIKLLFKERHEVMKTTMKAINRHLKPSDAIFFGLIALLTGAAVFGVLAGMR